MKNLIYVCLFSLLLFACDNQILDPSIGELEELNKIDSPENLVPKSNVFPKKIYKTIPIVSEFTFNPNAPEQNCGGFLNNCTLKYSYENERERYLRNLQIYIPSVLVADGKSYKTFNIYTINRYELLSDKGALISGHTWGTFKICKLKDDVIFDDETAVKYDQVAEDPLKDIGEVLISGEFSGEIKGEKTERKLTGKGYNMFSGSSLEAGEDLLCSNGMMCWTSKIIGQIKKVDFVDE